MIKIIPSLKLHSIIDDNEGIYLNTIVFEYGGNNYHFHGCTGSTIYAFREKNALYVLSINKSDSIICLDSFMNPEPDPISNVFLDNIQDIRNIIGQKWESIDAEVIVQKLIDYQN